MYEGGFCRFMESKLIKNISTLIGLIVALLILKQYEVLELREGIIIFIISLFFVICLYPVKDDMNVLRNATCEIQKYLMDKYKKFNPMHLVNAKGLAEPGSELKLTESGKKLLEASGADKLIDEYYAFLERVIELKSPKTPLDVQEYTANLIGELEDGSFMISIKDFVYKNPSFGSIDLELSDVQRIMALYLRDKYLEKHKELLKGEQKTQEKSKTQWKNQPKKSF